METEAMAVVDAPRAALLQRPLLKTQQLFEAACASEGESEALTPGNDWGAAAFFKGVFADSAALAQVAVVLPREQHAHGRDT